MGMLFSTPVTTARGILNDTRPSAYRYSTADLLGYCNDALKELVALAPEYFHQEGLLDCEVDSCQQSLPWSDASGLVNILGVVNGNAITPIDRTDLDLFKPAWQSDIASPAVHWMKPDTDRVRFTIYPKAPTGQQIRVVYLRTPSVFGINDDTGLPVTLEPAITDYIVGRAETRDDEHSNTGRAAAHLAMFKARFTKGVPNGVQSG